MIRLEATMGQTEGKLMVFGGAVDQYVCCKSERVSHSLGCKLINQFRKCLASIASTHSYYSAFDVVPYPLTEASVHNTDAMAPSSRSPIAVSDFAMTALANDTVLFVGGIDASGDMVKMDRLTAWSDEQDWYTLSLMGEIPQARIGASMVAHPTLKDLV